MHTGELAVIVLSTKHQHMGELSQCAQRLRGRENKVWCAREDWISGFLRLFKIQMENLLKKSTKVVFSGLDLSLI